MWIVVFLEQRNPRCRLIFSEDPEEELSGRVVIHQEFDRPQASRKELARSAFLARDLLEGQREPFQELIRRVYNHGLRGKGGTGVIPGLIKGHLRQHADLLLPFLNVIFEMARERRGS